MKKTFFIYVMCWSFMLICFLRETAAESIKVAAIFAQTGGAAKSNAPSLEGVRIATQKINAQGGILGKHIELLVFDNQSTPLG
jgi:branched-chain amino acid transport system substrate-binding protein